METVRGETLLEVCDASTSNFAAVDRRSGDLYLDCSHSEAGTPEANRVGGSVRLCAGTGIPVHDRCRHSKAGSPLETRKALAP